MASTQISGAITSRAWCWQSRKTTGSSSSVATLSETFIAKTGRPSEVVAIWNFFASEGNPAW